MFLKIRNLFNKIQRLGLTEDMTLIDRTILIYTNTFCIVCITISTIYTLINLFENNFFLSTISLCIKLCFVIALILQAQHHFKTSKAILLFGNAFFFSISALFFKNNAHFFLLTNLAAIIFLVKNKKIQTVSTILFLGMILLIEFVPIDLPFDSHVTPLKKAMNLIAGFSTLFLMIILFKDILYKHHKKIDEQRNKLIQSNQNMERILSIVAHDIRGPLSSIPPLITMYENDIISEKSVSSTLKTINKRIQNIDLTVINLLEWSSKNLKEIKTSPQDTNVKDIVEKVITILSPLSDQKNIRYDINISSTTQVYADPDHIQIILRNIVSNAIKFSERNNLIKILTTDEADSVLLKVIDFGIGIPADIINKLTYLAQSPAYGTEGERGVGIGLLLSSDLIHKNHGTLQFNSSAEVGTSVEIRIPKKDKS